MSLKTEWAENRWLRRQVACLPLMALWLALACWLSLGFLGFAGALPLDLAYIACCVMTGRTAGQLRVARQAETARLAKESAALRAPRAPDAGPGQCPVCAMDDLDALAADDRLMERGADRRKVVAYGSRRAHWACAEFVPYVEPNPHFEAVEIDGCKLYCSCPRCERTSVGPGAYYRCTFCGTCRRYAGMDAAREKLIAHAKQCPKRPPQDTGLFRPKGFEPETVINPGRVFTGPDGEQHVYCGPGEGEQRQRFDRYVERLAEALSVAEAPCKPTPALAEWRRQFEDPTPLGVVYTCRFCRVPREAPGMAEAERWLIEHARKCPKR